MLPLLAERNVTVSLAERSYEIVVRGGALADLGALSAGALGGGGGHSRVAAVVTDPAVDALYGGAARRSLAAAGFDPLTVVLPGGEEHKTLAAVEQIYAALHERAADRSSVVVALGGGVTGDIAGFAAASYLRGVALVQAPTTLLAQVDSSVGGKVGVNYKAAKNSIGAFLQPRLVVIDPDTLATLPERERRSGLAEVIKYGAIADPDLLELVATGMGALLAGATIPARLPEVIARSCAIKARVVERDERETTGARAALNFGHTIGHALEAITDYRVYTHGEAIALGMVSAALIGEALGVTPPECSRRLAAVLRGAGFAVRLPATLAPERVAALTAHDKKAVGGAARYVLLEEFGRCVAGVPVSADAVLQALRRQQTL